MPTRDGASGSAISSTIINAARWLGVTGWCWIAISIVLLFLPLTQSIGYESVLIINVMVVFLGGPRVRGSYPNTTVWTQFWQRSAEIVTLATISLLLLLLNTLRVPVCDLQAGLGQWFMFGVGSIPPVVALGLLCERLVSRYGRYADLALYLFITMLSLLASLWWLATQPPLIVYDAFTGFWAVSIYDEAQRPWYVHWPYRAMTSVGAVLWCQALAFEAEPSKARAAWIVVLSVVSGLLFAYKAELNIARSRADIQEMLGGRVETEHFVVHYEASAFTGERLTLLLADHEQQLAELHRAIGRPLPVDKMHAFIYGSTATKEQAMGSPTTMIARVWRNEMHLIWRGFGDATLRHEMSHLLLQNQGYGPLKLASKNGVIPLMGLVEGAASAIAWNVDALTDHQWSAAMMHNERMPQLSQMVAARSFWSQSGPLAYTLWSSFSRWLIDTYGMSRYLDAYRRGDFEGVYGTTLVSLTQEWENMLRTIELSEDELAEASLRFDRPSLFYAVCGRDVASHDTMAQESLMRRQWQTAEQHIAWLETQRAQDPVGMLRVSELWAWLGRHDKAMQIYRNLEQRDDAGLAVVQRARLAHADLAWKRGLAMEARTMLRQMQEHPIVPAMQRAIWVRAQTLQDEKGTPLSYRAVQHYLTQTAIDNRAANQTDILAAAFAEDQPATVWLAYRIAVGQQAYTTAEALAKRLSQETLPPPVAREFAFNELQRFAEQGQTSACDHYPYASDKELWQGNAITTRLEVLRRRCKESRLRLDGVRDAVE